MKSPSENFLVELHNSATINSGRLRSHVDRILLAREGHTIQILEIQGELTFSSMEQVMRDLLVDTKDAEIVIVNFRHTKSIGENCPDLLLRLWQSFDDSDRILILAELDHLPKIIEHFQVMLPIEIFRRVNFTQDLDTAMLWAENRILEKQEKSELQQVTTKDFTLCQNFTPEEIRELESLLESRQYEAGKIVILAGEPSTQLFFLKQGKASVIVHNHLGQKHRAVTYSPGMAFGEVAFLVTFIVRQCGELRFCRKRLEPLQRVP